MRPYAVFDIDGTLIRWQLYHALADALAKDLHFKIEDYQKVRQARMSWKKRSGEDSFNEYEAQLIQVFDKSLAGLDQAQFEAAADKVLEEYKDQVYTYTRDLIRKLKKQDYLIFAISGSPETMVKKLAEYYGFDEAIGSKYEIINGIFTGQKQLTVGRKSELLAELIKKHHASPKKSFAVGDSEGDIAMLEIVDQPIAFDPNRALKEFAIKNQWPIVVERKNVIYQLNPRDYGYQLEG